MRLDVLEERILSSLIVNMEEDELLGFQREKNWETEAPSTWSQSRTIGNVREEVD